MVRWNQVKAEQTNITCLQNAVEQKQGCLLMREISDGGELKARKDEWLRNVAAKRERVA